MAQYIYGFNKNPHLFTANSELYDSLNYFPPGIQTLGFARYFREQEKNSRYFYR